MVAASRPFADPAAAAAQLLFDLALILLMILTPVAEVFFHGPLYVLLPVGACILIVAGRVAQAREDRPDFRKVLRSRRSRGRPYSFFSGRACRSSGPRFPTRLRRVSSKALGTAVVVFLAIISLPSKTRATNLYLLPIGLAIAACAAIIFTFFEPQIFWQGEHPDATLAQRSVMSLMVLLWPALGALALREKMASRDCAGGNRHGGGARDFHPGCARGFSLGRRGLCDCGQRSAKSRTDPRLRTCRLDAACAGRSAGDICHYESRSYGPERSRFCLC